MIFWVVESYRTGVVGCETTKAAALALGAECGCNFDLHRVDVTVNAEAVRLLLGQNGGYANSTETISVLCG